MHSINEPTGTTVRLPDEARAAVADALGSPSGLGAALPDTDAGAYLAHGAKLLRNCLPPQTLDALASWRREPTPWLTLTNLPEQGSDVPTPQDGFCDESLVTLPNLVHFGLLRLLGLTPVAYRWENDGRLIRNVAPRAEAARTNTSWGYARPLDWHTDDSVLEHGPHATATEAIPHYLSFYGVRNTEGVPTGQLPVDAVLAALAPETAEALRRPEFAVSAPESYRAGDDGRPAARTAVPLLWTLPDGRTGLRYGPGLARGLTAEAGAALAAFEAVLAGMDGAPVLIGAGGFHVFDNRRVMHRRVPFTPAAAGRARWLRRCYALGPVAAGGRPAPRPAR
ncbi:TauD/TfdA family dioxygenase [Kitasatospora sp. NPDC057223]|uniref:TauD/TfdA family dioxygenase n=1 Tax=Kitasatospora sp. NPDC057223 TaxID=3346055 RepID=UPI0036267782